MVREVGGTGSPHLAAFEDHTIRPAPRAWGLFSLLLVRHDDPADLTGYHIMRNFLTSCLLAVALAGVLAGCGGSGGTGTPVDPGALNKAASRAELKTRLEEIAKSGVAGSGLAGMDASITSVVEDAALQKELLEEYSKLSSAKGPAQVKSIATKMASKL